MAGRGGTTLAYDLNDNLLSLTDARNNPTTFTYDVMDRVVTRTDPLVKTESTVYDLMGNVVRHTDRKGQVTTYEYDGLGRQISAGFGTVGTPPSANYESTVTTTYDAGDRVLSLVDSQAGTIQRTYDGLDRLLTETTPQGSVTYTYDAASRRNTLTVTGQPSVTYAYDNADRLTTIQQGTTTVSYTYDNANRPVTLTLPNGIVVETSHDANSRSTGLAYRLGPAVIGDLTYSYDAAGQRVQVAGSFGRTELPATVPSAAYDAANRPIHWGGATLNYDLNGNLTSDGATTFIWDARDRLASLSRTGLSGTFSYDASGRRAGKSVNGAAVAFLYDTWNPVQEQVGGTPLANLLTGLAVDEYLARDTGTGPRSYLADALGSTLALTAPTGNLETTYAYEPFGRSTVSGTPTSNSFRFSGREADQPDLLYHRTRYYSPLTHRFLSEDHVGLEAGPNVYAYVHNNTLRWTDPFGLDVFNGGRNPIWVKPSRHGEPLKVVQPGRWYRGDQDGFADPCGNPGQVFKTVNGIDARATGSPFVPWFPSRSANSRRGTIRFPTSFVGQMWQGGWKDKVWATETHPDWKELYDASLSLPGKSECK